MGRVELEAAGIKAFDKEGIEGIVAEAGQPAFRAGQLIEWIYGKNAQSYEEMTNLPKALREELAGSYPLFRARIAEKLVSSDGSRKYIVAYQDGTLVETVGIPGKARLTVCFSTQAGCANRCSLCATGKGGFVRNLAPGEIYDQVSLVAEDFDRRATNAVAMGQGEPFANYEATLAAARFLNAQNGGKIGARHITISTCGIIPMIRRFANEPEQFTLAISLHSAVQKTRNRLMPAMRDYDLARLRDSAVSYAKTTGRRPTYEYAMIDGLNDTDEELAALVDFCRHTLCHVNLIPLNKVPGSKYKPSREARVDAFAQALSAVGVETTVRASRGADIDGACGQLMQRLSREKSQPS